MRSHDASHRLVRFDRRSMTVVRRSSANANETNEKERNAIRLWRMRRRRGIADRTSARHRARARWGARAKPYLWIKHLDTRTRDAGRGAKDDDTRESSAVKQKRREKAMVAVVTDEAVVSCAARRAFRRPRLSSRRRRSGEWDRTRTRSSSG